MSQNLVYKITFPNGKVYIGITTKGLANRIKEHQKMAYLKKYKVQKAILKYGLNNCNVEVIFECDCLTLLKSKEKDFIKLYNSFKNGYNMTLGGDGAFGYKHSIKTRKIIKEKRKFQLAKTDHLAKYRGINKKSVIDNFDNKFISLLEAAKFYNMSTANIALCIKNKRPTKIGVCFKYNLDNKKCDTYVKTTKRIYKPYTKDFRKKLSDCSSLKKKIINTNGIIYESITVAAFESGISRKHISRLLKNGKLNKFGIGFNYAKSSA